MQTLENDIAIIVGDRDQGRRLAATALTCEDKTLAYRQLVEIAENACLGIVRTVALLLKFEFQLRSTDEHASESEPRLPVELIDGNFYRVLGRRVTNSSRSASDDLFLLVSELLLLNVQRMPNDSAALHYIDQQYRITCEQLSVAGVEARRNYCSGKCAWLNHNERLRTLTELRDILARQNENLRNRFLSIFAAEYLQERAQLARMQVAQLRLQLLNENPGASATTIEDLVARTAGERRENLKGHQLSVSYGCFTPVRNDPGDSKADYELARHLLRKIAAVTHPDRVSHCKLAWQQQEQLRAIWHESSALRAERDNVILLSQSLPKIRRQLQLAEHILALAGIEFLDAALVIPAAPVAASIEWFQHSNEQLERDVTAVQMDVFALNADRENRFFKAVLDAPDEIRDQERQAMKSNTAHYRLEAETLEKTASQLLATRA
jgi:hypothetical protein